MCRQGLQRGRSSAGTSLPAHGLPTPVLLPDCSFQHSLPGCAGVCTCATAVCTAALQTAVQGAAPHLPQWKLTKSCRQQRLSALRLSLSLPCACMHPALCILAQQLTTLSCEQLLQNMVTVQVLPLNHNAPDLHPLGST